MATLVVSTITPQLRSISQPHRSICTANEPPISLTSPFESLWAWKHHDTTTICTLYHFTWNQCTLLFTAWPQNAERGRCKNQKQFALCLFKSLCTIYSNVWISMSLVYTRYDTFSNPFCNRKLKRMRGSILLTFFRIRSLGLHLVILYGFGLCTNYGTPAV